MEEVWVDESGLISLTAVKCFGQVSPGNKAYTIFQIVACLLIQDCGLSPFSQESHFHPNWVEMEVWKEKLTPLSWIKCISPGREGTGLKVPKFPSHLCPPTACSSAGAAKPGAVRGSGGGGSAGRGQKCHCSPGAPGVTAAAEVALEWPAWPDPAWSEPGLRREEEEQGIALLSV